MVMDAVVECFIEQSPDTVMARVALQRALDPAWGDALFEQERREQYKGDLLFSTTVELMSVVAVGPRPSLASEQRIEPRRGFRGAALPGHALVIYDPDLDMAADLAPCEDGHAQVRSLTAPLLEQAQAGDLLDCPRYDRQILTSH